MINIDDIRRYILGSHAVFTLTSKASGKSFTYQRWDTKHGRFVSVLTGPDNTGDYTPLGKVWAPEDGTVLRLYPLKKQRIGQEAPSWKALEWFLRSLDRLTEDAMEKVVEFRHEGVCARCGRTLTTPESIDRGIGPICASK